MTRNQYNKEMNRRYMERMADATYITVTKVVDAVGHVSWSVRCYNAGRGLNEFIGGLSNTSYESAVRAAHEYALLPGSLTGSQPIG